MKRIYTYLSLLAVLLLPACSGEETEGIAGGGEARSFTVTYTIPDAEVPTRASASYTEATRAAVTRSEASYVEATGTESTVDGLHLLFFASDAHGNGRYVARASATLEGASLKQNSVKVTLPSGVNASGEYDVLVVANLAKYAIAPEMYLAMFEKKTYGQAWEELQALLPVTPNGIYSFPDGRLPMSGTCTKAAGSTELKVDLLRAAVRVDVKVTDTEAILHEAQLQNVVPVVPFFRTQEETDFTCAASARFAVTGNGVTGGLYAVETSLDVLDNQTLQNKATCLLVNVSKPSIHKEGDAGKTWYRINLNVSSDKMQFLKRNNAYTVVITGVYAPGASTPDEAYHNQAILIQTVTIPTGWLSSGIATPPEIVIG